jgi:beta-phosphoglucomutase
MMNMPKRNLLDLQLKPPKGVIFDFDGTVIDSEAIHFELYRKAAKALGANLTLHDYETRMKGKTDKAIFEAIVSISVIKPKVDELIKQKQDAFLVMLEQGKIPPIKGVVEYIDYLAINNVLIGLATSATRQEALTGLNILGIENRFCAIATAESVKRGKPAPDVYLAASEAMGLSSSSCLVYEDAEAGVQGATAAQMRVIAVGSKNNQALIQAGALDVIENYIAHRLWFTSRSILYNTL